MKIKNQPRTAPSSSATKPYGRNATNAIWVFKRENLQFEEFEKRNHEIIEKAYRNPNKQSVVIDDAVIPATNVTVHFGVETMHLRMPGTRYYVKRIVPNRKSPSVLSPSSVTSYPLIQQNMPSPVSTASTSTSSCASSPDYPLDPTLTALISGDMMFAGPNENTFSYSPSSYNQYFTPIDKNEANNGVQPTTTSTTTTTTTTLHNSETPFNIDNYYKIMNYKQTNYLGYPDNDTQYAQPQSLVPMDTILDYNLPAPIVTDTANLLQDVDWLSNTINPLCAYPSTFLDGMSIQELISWPGHDSSLEPKPNSCDYENIGMTNENLYAFLQMNLCA